jgi:hypothetical protein
MLSAKIATAPPPPPPPPPPPAPPPSDPGLPESLITPLMVAVDCARKMKGRDPSALTVTPDGIFMLVKSNTLTVTEVTSENAITGRPPVSVLNTTFVEGSKAPSDPLLVNGRKADDAVGVPACSKRATPTSAVARTVTVLMAVALRARRICLVIGVSLSQ